MWSVYYLPGAPFSKAHVLSELTLTTNEETGTETLSNLPMVTQLGSRKLRRLTHTHTHTRTHSPLNAAGSNEGPTTLNSTFPGLQDTWRLPAFPEMRFLFF